MTYVIVLDGKPFSLTLRDVEELEVLKLELLVVLDRWVTIILSGTLSVPNVIAHGKGGLSVLVFRETVLAN
jgi:hypothetical protein